MTLQYGPWVAIDFETSAWRGACACAVGMVRLQNLEIVDRYYTLIRPASKRISFTYVHGLTWKMLKNERTFSEVWPEMLKFMDGARYLVAHNAAFDQNVLYSCCEACGLEIPAIPFLCTLKGSRRQLSLPSYTLDSVSSHLGIALDHHHAGSDAEACGLLLCRLAASGLDPEDMLIAPPRNRRRSSAKDQP